MVDEAAVGAIVGMPVGALVGIPKSLQPQIGQVVVTGPMHGQTVSELAFAYVSNPAWPTSSLSGVFATFENCGVD